MPGLERFWASVGPANRGTEAFTSVRVHSGDDCWELSASHSAVLQWWFSHCSIAGGKIKRICQQGS